MYHKKIQIIKNDLKKLKTDGLPPLSYNYHKLYLIKNKLNMAEYRISGVWKDSNNVITHYAFHTVSENSISRASKKTRADAITLLETKGNSATTWLWNYTQAGWNIGETVEVVSGKNGKYLRSNPDKTLTDNLAHLIDFDWIAP
ncbi:hypothetical protein CNR22_23300 [Sphingobacteriaceae bacterium]|nr:hypothetical protein CNR22_23300 [Sphingobacteriaceae bacterium]